MKRSACTPEGTPSTLHVSILYSIKTRTTIIKKLHNWDFLYDPYDEMLDMLD